MSVHIAFICHILSACTYVFQFYLKPTFNIHNFIKINKNYICGSVYVYTFLYLQ